MKTAIMFSVQVLIACSNHLLSLNHFHQAYVAPLFSACQKAHLQLLTPIRKANSRCIYNICSAVPYSDPPCKHTHTFLDPESVWVQLSCSAFFFHQQCRPWDAEGTLIPLSFVHRDIFSWAFSLTISWSSDSNTLISVAHWHSLYWSLSFFNNTIS